MIDINKMFAYHEPRGTQLRRYAEIREKAREFADLIQEYTPVSAEQTLAIRAVHQAMLQANAAIAINEA